MILLLTVVLAGTATAQDTVEVSNAQEIQNVTEVLDGDYVLTDDIDLSDTEFEPIGDIRTPFTGSFDGNGHTVSGLTVEPSGNRFPQDFAGLFGVIGTNGTVRELGIEDSRVVGGQDVGGITGVNNGEIRRSYFDGEISGNTAVGGLVGLNYGELSRSYATVRVEATGNDVGGIVGSNIGNMTETYAAGTVMSDGTGIGGAVGTGPGNTSRVYWDTELSGISGSEDSAGTGLTTDEMTGGTARDNMDLDFDGTWRTTQVYPALVWQSDDAVVEVPDDGTGDGDVNDDTSDDGDGDTDGTDEDNADDTSDDTEGMPGFGTLVALTALSVGVFLRRRR
ncbi:MAG: PGF-CTERM sorting domain-containing protein [Halobacteriales archaeon]|nr:PGF-CTERM sorting domain-containing protein [Halobacteriales archaeon]